MKKTYDFNNFQNEATVLSKKSINLGTQLPKNWERAIYFIVLL